MPDVPLPFVVALLLAVLLGRMLVEGRGRAAGRAALFFVAVAMLAAVVSGLHWSYQVAAARAAQPLVAALLPPAAWFAWAHLARERPFSLRDLALHGLPFVTVAMLVLFWRGPIDVVLVAEFLGYGAALIRLGRGGPDGFGAARIEEAVQAARMAAATGWLLVFSGAVDVLVALDFGLSAGVYSPAILAVSSLAMLLATAGAIAFVGRAAPAADPEAAAVAAAADPALEPASEPATADAEDDRAVVAALDRLMAERRLYRDPELTLERLARRAVIPARRVSAAINRTTGGNVSQWVNAHRVAEARRLLAETDLPVTEVMLEAGFQTKSNFNREFRRLTGTSPSGYRQDAAG